MEEFLSMNQKEHLIEYNGTTIRVKNFCQPNFFNILASLGGGMRVLLADVNLTDNIFSENDGIQPGVAASQGDCACSRGGSIYVDGKLEKFCSLFQAH